MTKQLTVSKILDDFGHEFINRGNEENARIELPRKAEQSLKALFTEMVEEIIGEDVRPVYSGHTYRCAICGEIGGMCEDEYCTGNGGLNAHDDDHKSIECACERQNKRNSLLRQRAKAEIERRFE